MLFNKLLIMQVVSLSTRRDNNTKWETTACNSCGSKKYSILWKSVANWEFPDKFRVVKCKICSLVFLNPRPRKNQIGLYYKKESYWGQDISISQEINFLKIDREIAYGPLYKLILKKKKKGSIFDVGAGTGLFLTKFVDLGWKVNGIELSKDTVIFAKKAYKINLKTRDFLDFKLPKEQYDVVTLNNSLEHLYKPLETLRTVNKILKDDGFVVITVPNLESIGSFIFRSHWYPLQPPIHLYHFTLRTLTDILNRAGFAVQSVNHSYWEHNYYSIFQSIRFLFPSNKIRMISRSINAPHSNKMSFSFIKELGKVLGKLFAFLTALLAPFLRKGEVIIVYAKK